ncbi:baculoviral IAP repeat-containing protein 1-like [Diadema setosum]|uniref:baculoviral IAP repeat-containing protein 1-like n=1 Tax=Diadema setosum TaxID=31175 RepID=UPI003B3B63E5
MITVPPQGLHGTEQTFTCIAIGDSLMTGASAVEIVILPIPEKHVHVGLIVGLVIGVPIAIAILSLLVGKLLQKYYPDYLRRKGCGCNPSWRRPRAQVQLREEEELMMAPTSVLLTKEQVQQCQEELKAHYRKSRCKVTVDPFSFMEHVDLARIDINLSQTDVQSGRKTPTTYGELLTSVSKRIFLQGERGIGKTTLCAKIAWDWSHGRILQDLDMVLLIPLRDVTDAKSVSCIVKRYLSDSNTATPNQIDNYISTSQNKVLLVLDGFDEYHGNMCENNRSEVIRILELEQYKSCKVIVTTRQWEEDELWRIFRFSENYIFVSVEGFNKENLSTYIRRYFQEKDALSESLITFMEENYVVQKNMAPFPIYCIMFCLMWNNLNEERRKETQKVQTNPQIFEEIISFLTEHYTLKVCENPQDQNAIEQLKGKVGRAIQDISEIALNGLLDRKLSFREEHFRDCRDAMETSCKVRFLTMEREVDIPSFFVSTVSFPHKFFQEYVAGFYVEYLFTNDRAKYDDLKETLLSRHEEFRYLLYFTSSLGNELGLDVLGSLIECSTQDYCVDVAFECHTEEAARAVGKRWKEYEVSPDTPEHTKSGIAFMVHCNQVVDYHPVGLSVDGQKESHRKEISLPHTAVDALPQTGIIFTCKLAAAADLPRPCSILFQASEGGWRVCGRSAADLRQHFKNN